MVPIYSIAEESEANFPNSYTIYPTPHSVVYGSAGTTLANVNIVITEGADVPSKTILEKTLDDKAIAFTYSNTLSDEKTNIVLGITDDNDTITGYFNALALSDTSALEKLEGHVISVKDGNIYVVGNKAISLYYGVLTLNQMINTSVNLKDILINDYSDNLNRGTVEGFYGVPWSHDARISILEMMGKYKMNMYIYAPKDDPYHFGEHWNVPYPDEELAKMKELVDSSQNSNIDFVYTLHVGENMDLTDEDDLANALLPERKDRQWDQSGNDSDRGVYVPEGQPKIDAYDADETRASFIAKFEQMYSVGVRRFGIFADDISFPVARYSIPYLVNFMNDIQAYFDENYDDIEPLVFCPSYYHSADTNYNGRTYMKYINNGHTQAITTGLNSKVEVMWTGRHVMSDVKYSNNQTLANYAGRNPLIWWNYPVTDYVPRYVVLGPNPGLTADATNMTGVISNPMQQGFASEISLFGVADYAWNLNGYDRMKSWENSFNHLFPEVADSLYLIAQNATRGYDSKYMGTNNAESTYLQAYLMFFKAAVNSGDMDEIMENGEALKYEFDRLLAAIEDVRNNCDTDGLLSDLKPWLDKLESLCISGNALVRAFTTDNLETMWQDYSAVNSEMTKWPSITVEQLGGGAVSAEIGIGYITPFITDMTAKLEANLNVAVLTGDKLTSKNVIFSNIPSLENISVSKVLNSYSIENANLSLDYGRFVGMKLENAFVIDDITLSLDKNVFDKLEVQISVNGVEWTTVEGSVSNNTFTATLDSELARYIRVVNNNIKSVDFNITSFKVDVSKGNPQKVSSAETTASIYQTNAPIRLVDGNYTTPYWADENQRAGQEVVIEYAEEFALYDFALYEATDDYIRNGSIYVSTDKENWTKISALGTNFTPEKIGTQTYNVIRGFANGVTAKYVKIATESTANNWTKLFEWEINQNIKEVSGKLYPFSLVADGVASNIIDGNVSTHFTTISGESSLKYVLSEYGNADSLVVLQNAENLSDAVLKIRTTTGWHEIGVLDKATNTFDLSHYPDILEVEIVWTENGIVPKINELFTVTGTKDASALTEKIDEIIVLADKFPSNSKNHQTLQNALNLAKSVLDDNMATRGMYADAVELLNVAKRSTIIFTVLKNAVARAEKMLEDGDFEGTLPSIMRILDVELEKAYTIFDGAETTQEEVNEITLKIINIITMCDWKVGNKDNLNLLEELATIIEGNLDKYLDKGKTDFVASLEAAREMLADEDAMEDELEKAYDELIETLLVLRLKPDKEHLAGLLVRAEQVDQSLYTNDSISMFNYAVANAKLVFEDENAAQSEVVRVDEKLAKAISGLVFKSNNTGTTDTNTSNSAETTVSTKQDKVTPVVAKDPEGTSASPASAKTGENSNVFVSLILFSVALCVVATLNISKKKSSKK